MVLEEKPLVELKNFKINADTATEVTSSLIIDMMS